MKKILTFVLVVAMIATLTVGAFAETLPKVSSSDITITNNINNSASDKVYSVDVTWTNTALTASTTITGSTWNPETHEWSGGNTVTTWENATVTVTVTNHSNAQVKATLTAPATTDGVTFTAPETELICEDASLVALDAPDATDKENTKVFTITASGNTEKSNITVQASVSISVVE